jgi:hypothetical protein
MYINWSRLLFEVLFFLFFLSFAKPFASRRISTTPSAQGDPAPTIGQCMRATTPRFLPMAQKAWAIAAEGRTYELSVDVSRLA